MQIGGGTRASKAVLAALALKALNPEERALARETLKQESKAREVARAEAKVMNCLSHRAFLRSTVSPLALAKGGV